MSYGVRSEQHIMEYLIMYYLYHRITGMFLNGLHLVPLHEAEAFSTEHEANAWLNTMHNHEQFSLVQVNFI